MKKLFYYISALVILTVSSCKPEETGDCTPQITEVSGSINEATTWDACHLYHVTGQVVLNAALTIEPGTVIKFDEDEVLTVTSSGKIIANGTSQKMIVFTSWKDDNAGGDSNGDGTATTSQAGDWAQINLAHSTGNVFNYCKIMYAGGNQTLYYAVTLLVGDGESNTLTNSVIAYNLGAADHTSGTVDMTQAPASSVVNNNTFYGNFRPLAVSNVINVDNSNVFHNPANTSETNVANGIFVQVYFTSTTAVPDITYSETEVPYVFADDNSYTIPFPRKITIGVPGVIFKMGPSFSLNISTADQLSNHDLTGVYFTSLKDDSKLGDTNGDGSATAAGGSDWDGIWEIPTGTYFDWANIEHAN